MATTITPPTPPDKHEIGDIQQGQSTANSVDDKAILEASDKFLEAVLHEQGLNATELPTNESTIRKEINVLRKQIAAEKANQASKNNSNEEGNSKRTETQQRDCDESIITPRKIYAASVLRNLPAINPEQLSQELMETRPSTGACDAVDLDREVNYMARHLEDFAGFENIRNESEKKAPFGVKERVKRIARKSIGSSKVAAARKLYDERLQRNYLPAKRTSVKASLEQGNQDKTENEKPTREKKKPSSARDQETKRKKKKSSQTKKSSNFTLSKPGAASESSESKIKLPKSQGGSTPRVPAKEIWCGTPDESLDGGWPEGWTKKVFQRQTGKTKGSTDRYWYSPSGKKLRSMTEVKKFMVILSDFRNDEKEAWRHFKGKA